MEGLVSTQWPMIIGATVCQGILVKIVRLVSICRTQSECNMCIYLPHVVLYGRFGGFMVGAQDSGLSGAGSYPVRGQVENTK